MKIQLKTIPHSKQRYETVGDWIFDSRGNLKIVVSEMSEADYGFLVSVHELIEAWLCQKRSISEESVTAFDIQFEKERALGNHTLTDEPGDDRRAPYRREHQFATKIEHAIARELGVNWAQYASEVESL